MFDIEYSTVPSGELQGILTLNCLTEDGWSTFPFMWRGTQSEIKRGLGWLMGKFLDNGSVPFWNKNGKEVKRLPLLAIR